MLETHTIMLIIAAPDVAELFRTDPAVADLLDPAAFVGDDEDGGVSKIVERLQLTKLMSGWTLKYGDPIQSAPPGEGLVSVLVACGNGTTHYWVPDPRIDANLLLWPWKAGFDHAADDDCDDDEDETS